MSTLMNDAIYLFKNILHIENWSQNYYFAPGPHKIKYNSASFLRFLRSYEGTLPRIG